MSTVRMTKTSTVTETSGPATTIKTQYSSSSEGRPYQSSQRTRTPVVITRTSGVYGQPAGSTRYSKQMSFGYGAGAGMGPPPGAYANVSAIGVSSVKNSREKEKKDMQDLNERFASYIEKVRFLEAQNRKLADELENLKKQWGRETASVKRMYQTELDEARKLLDDSENDKARLEIRNASLEEQVEELRNQLDELKAELAQKNETIENQNQQLSDYEAEINLLRRRLSTLEQQSEKDKKEIKRLTDALARARCDLDAESLARVIAENRAETLEEELQFLRDVHEQEMKEMAALAYRDTTKENREFWKNELAQCLSEIQAMYDTKLDAMRGELQQYYDVKMQEFRTGSTRQGMETQHAKEETKRLRSQLTELRAKLAELEARNAMLEKEMECMRRDYEEKEREWEAENTELKTEVAKLRAEMEAILKELQDLMDTKLGLELEIAAYRKLLEGEENRGGFRSVVESMMTSGGSYGQYEDDDSSLRMSQVVKGEMSAKTTYQRSAKGPVSITECAADGSYIIVENNGKKEENVEGWTIKRIIDGRKEVNYKIKQKILLGTQKHNCRAKIWAEGKEKKEPNFQSFEMDKSTWGVGGNISTSLLDENDQGKAEHNQKTQYVS